MPRGTGLRSLALLFLALTAVSFQLVAQDAPSVAEAAKRVRQQQQESAKPAKVITNDTLRPAPAEATPPADPNLPASSGDSPAPADAAVAAPGAKKPAESPEELEKKKAEIESLKKEIAFKQDALTTMQGAVALDENTYYSRPDYKLHADQKEKIDAEKRDLERMQAEMAELHARLAELGVVIEPKPPAPKESITQNAPPQS
jgi:hypothetical protein